MTDKKGKDDPVIADAKDDDKEEDMPELEN